MRKYAALILSLLMLGAVSTHAFSATHTVGYNSHDLDKKGDTKGDDDGGDDDGDGEE